MDIGTRMKNYENSARLPKGITIIRVDGVNFHTWTRMAKLERPFDLSMHAAMQYAAQLTSHHFEGFKLAYIQSDECTFVLQNLNPKSDGWFGQKLHKLNSLPASLFTYYFNEYLRMDGKNVPPAFFDARAFSIPVEDAANNIVWRQKDNSRNYIQAYAHSVLPKKQVHGKSNKQLLELLKAGLELLPDWAKYGTFYINCRLESCWLDYEKLNEYILEGYNT